VRKIIWIATAAATAAFGLPAAAPASEDDIRRRGECSGGSSSKIRVKPDDGGLEVEFEIDQNRNGVRWKVKIKDNSEVVIRDSARTKPPSGSFSFERRIPNRSGTDNIVGIARNKRSGERCVAKVSI
jgi:hypothetical protein